MEISPHLPVQPQKLYIFCQIMQLSFIKVKLYKLKLYKLYKLKLFTDQQQSRQTCVCSYFIPVFIGSC